MALTWPLEQVGSTGENVKSVQYLVTAQGHATGVDGVFGAQTKAAVEAFQSAHGLGADGAVGAQTWPRLIVQVQSGSSGDAVQAVQSQIHGRGNGQIAVDGSFGETTSEAVRGFQSLVGLTADGIVGSQTWMYLVNGYLSATDAQTAATDMFSAWKAHDRDRAARDGTPAAVAQLFAQTFAVGDGWTFKGGGVATGHAIFTWQRSNGHQLKLDVSDGVEFYFPVDNAAFS
jgi:peptidoglycan hydrolase-like protein with peptidoglycan-binding domain